MQIEVKTVKLSAINLNPNNPRRISTPDMERLTKSVEGFKKMLKYRPIVYDRDRVIIGGNMRFLALKKLGYKEVPEEWLRCADDFTDEERRQFIITDNGQFGQWDFDLLANGWDDLPLADWGVPLPEDWLGDDTTRKQCSVASPDDEAVIWSIVCPKEKMENLRTRLAEVANRINQTDYPEVSAIEWLLDAQK